MPSKYMVNAVRIIYSINRPHNLDQNIELIDFPLLIRRLAIVGMYLNKKHISNIFNS